MTVVVKREFAVRIPAHLQHTFGASVPAQLLFWRETPHAVVIRLCGVHGPRDWRVSRHTLLEGLLFRTALDLVARVEPLGESGDVRVSLTSGVAGHVVFDMPGADLHEALDATGELVPFGQEHDEHDWDGWLRGAAT